MGGLTVFSLSRYLAAALTFGFALIACSEPLPPVASTKQSDRISVLGHGLVEVVPDKVSFVVGVDARAEDAEIAYRSVDETLDDVMAALRRLKIDEQQVQAMMLNLNPIIDYKQRNKVIAYEVRRDVRVTVSNVEVYGRAIKVLSGLGITRFQQVSMTSSKLETLKIEALAKAYDNARAKAEELASRAGRELGDVEWVREAGATGSPRNALMRSEMASARLAVSDSAGASPVSSGLISVQSSLEVSFTLKSR